MRSQKKSYISSLSAICVVALCLLGCDFNFSVGKPKQPTAEELQEIVRETISDFGKALENDDFDGLIKTTSKGFQQQYTAEQMETAFGKFYERRDVSVPMFEDARSMSAEFTRQSQMNEKDKNYYLEVEGKFSTKPHQLKFNFIYIRESGKWKLTKFQINA